MREPTASLIADSHGLICAFQLAPLLPLNRSALDTVAPGMPVWLHLVECLADTFEGTVANVASTGEEAEDEMGLALIWRSRPR